MKKIFFIIAFIYSVAFGQSWNNTVTTTISASSLDKMDLFTNKDGNHLIIRNSNGNIVYYNFNSQGTVDNSKTETLESNGDYPAITGSNDKIYAIYKAGNYIKGKYSTNGGTDWTALSNINIGSNACNGLDAVYEIGRGVHLVYAMRDSDPYFETYYYLLNTNNAWVNYKNVTDVANYQYGGYPTVAFSTDRIHVSFNTGNGSIPGNQGDAKSRDKYNSTWQTPQTISSGSGNLSSAEKIQVAGSTLFDFYFLFVEGMGQYHNDLYVKTRGTSGTTWSSATSLGSFVDVTSFMGAESTADETMHIAYTDDDKIYHRSYSTSWSSTYTITSDLLYYTNIGFATNSNDLYVSWKPYNSNYIKYRQYDAAPLTPANFAGTIYNNHPKLTWSANNEPDLE